MKNIKTYLNNFLRKNTVPRFLCGLTLGAVGSTVFSTPVLAEGSYQINSNSDTVQTLYSYDARLSTATTFLKDIRRPIYVDILNDNEIINVSACAGGDDIRIEIYKVDNLGTPPNVISGDNLTQVRTQLLTANNANIPTCTTAGILTSATAPVTYAVNPGAGGLGIGTYQVRIINVTDNSGGGVSTTITDDNITQFDITVSSTARPYQANAPANSTTNSGPSQTQGRIWSYNWGFNANRYDDAGTTDMDFYIVTPTNLDPINPFVWRLDMEEVAGYVYEIMANQGGVDSPNAQGRIVRGLSVPYGEQTSLVRENDVTPQFRQYLSYPALYPNAPNVTSDDIDINSFRFVDSDNEDNVISPGVTGGTQDAGNFIFSTNNPGTYVIIIDIDDDGNEGDKTFGPSGFNPDGIFGVGDIVLRGDTVNGELVVPWDGTSNLGTILPTGVYPARLQAITGEYHFVATDIEHSGPAGGGITIFNASGGGNSPTNVYWDDITGIQFDKYNTNKCVLPGDANCTSLPDGFLSTGTRHRWGTTPTNGGFNTSTAQSAQFGNLRFLDTYVYGAFAVAQTPVVIISDGSDPNPDGPKVDYGDAPDTYNTDRTPGNDGAGNTDQDGASHNLSLVTPSPLYLGTNPPDGEFDATPAAPGDNAVSDDSTGITPDDEDGITSFNTLTVGDTSYTVEVNVKNSTGKNAYLVGWIDFNRDGKFEAAEGVRQVIATNASAQNINLTWSGLSGLVAGNTYARLRLSTYSELDETQYFGTFADGEVEDYILTITDATTPSDYGDAPDTYKTLASNNGPSHFLKTNLRLGANGPDAEADGQPTVGADGDDTAETPDDEDGVTFPDPFTSGNALTTVSTDYEVTVNVTNQIGTPATLVGWIDFNKDGVFDASEGQLLTIDDNTLNSDVTLNWTGLSGLTTGDTYARFRISNGVLTTATPTGAIGSGEVEDYLVTIYPVDFGDAPDDTNAQATGDYQTTLTNGGASHIIFSSLKMGTNEPDADDGTLQNIDANADDTNNTDDEDGVTLPALTATATDYTARVKVTNNTGQDAYLVGWIDFNKNGIFESTEASIYDATPGGDIDPIIDGTDANLDLTWSSLSGLTIGDIVYARFRLTTDINVIGGNITTPVPEPLTSLGVGEVEDYKIIVTDATVSNPNVLLVKRITSINGDVLPGTGGQPLNQYNQDPAYIFDDNDNATNFIIVDHDNNPGTPDIEIYGTDKWPDTTEDTASTFLIGAINGGTVDPNDTLEYSIYFLSAGTADAKNVILCDRLPQKTIFIPDTYEAGKGITLYYNLNNDTTIESTPLTNVGDGDRGRYIPPGVDLTTFYPDIATTKLCGTDSIQTSSYTANSTGVVIVELGLPVDPTDPSKGTYLPKADAAGTPNTSYGYVRFQVKFTE